MPNQRSLVQPIAFIPFPLTRLTSASACLGQAFLMISFVTCLTIGYPIEPALGIPTTDDIMKALPISGFHFSLRNFTTLWPLWGEPKNGH